MKDLEIFIVIVFVAVIICLIKMSTSTHGVNKTEDDDYPTYRRRVWYNTYAYMRSDHLTLINVDDNSDTIKPYTGLQLPTIPHNGRYAIYEIVKVIDDSYNTSNDYLYSSDAYHVDVKLIKVVNQIIK